MIGAREISEYAQKYNMKLGKDTPLSMEWCFKMADKAYEKGKADMLKEIEEAMYIQCFERNNDEDMQKWDGGNWFRYKLFENVLEQIKESKDV
ncbi:MAG: hypothetical protein MJZ37_07850 [Bacilli bacterium]|nr:hypothetical protein [Bacilli bacterium]